MLFLWYLLHRDEPEIDQIIDSLSLYILVQKDWLSQYSITEYDIHAAMNGTKRRKRKEGWMDVMSDIH